MLIRHLSSVAFAPTALAYIRQSSGAGKGGCRALGAFEIASMDLMAGEHGVVAVRWGVIAMHIGRGRRANRAWSPCNRAWSPCKFGVVAVQTGVVAVQVWAWSPCFALNCESADVVISAVRERWMHECLDYEMQWVRRE